MGDHKYSRNDKLSYLDNPINIYNFSPGFYNFVHYYPSLETLPKLESRKALVSRIRCEKNKVGLYIHIPFCGSSCRYCFYKKKIRPTKDEVDRYLKYLQIECEYVGGLLNQGIYSLYIGGGTPSYLNSEEIIRIFKLISNNFDISEVNEITFEIEPGSINENKLNTIIDLNVDRISMGIQSLDDRILHNYNRCHNSEEAKRKVLLLKNSKIKTFNIDFIYGLSNQSINDIEESIEFIKYLNPPSVTYYQSWFHSRRKNVSISWKDKVWKLEQISHAKIKIRESLSNLGYFVDNQCWFVKSDSDRCLHFNFTWKNNSYIGIGLSAYSYINKYSYQNSSNFNEYYGLLDRHEIPAIRGRLISDEEKAQRALILGLKTNGGINIPEIFNNYRVCFADKTEPLLNNLCNEGLLIRQNGRLMFSDKGQMWGDYILYKFMDERLFERNEEEDVQYKSF